MPILPCLNRGGYFNLCYPDLGVGEALYPLKKKQLEGQDKGPELGWRQRSDYVYGRARKDIRLLPGDIYVIQRIYGFSPEQGHTPSGIELSFDGIGYHHCISAATLRCSFDSFGTKRGVRAPF